MLSLFVRFHLRLLSARRGDDGQTTAEYALVLLGAAAIALLLVAWATKTNRIGKLLDFVVDQIIGRGHVTRRGPGDGGQSTVELALVLPVVALVSLAVVQVAAIAHHQVLVVHAAREAARAAAVADDDPSGAAVRAALRAGGLDDARITVRTRTGDREVSVTVDYRETTDIALAGGLLPDLTLTASATMRREAVSASRTTGGR